MGEECRRIANQGTTDVIDSLLNDEAKLSTLVAEMVNGQPEFNLQLIDAFADGILNRQTSNH